MRWLLLGLVTALTTLLACSAQHATPEQCRAIFDRLVILELREMGFQDPALAKIRQKELASQYQGEIDTCVGRPLPAGAMECIAKAKNAESLSHGCLD